ncbi:hypothetical protein HDV63DRAFT_395506 [Trichoderma sp. SZMC 28014]
MFSAQDIRRVQPVAPRVQVSNFQLPGSNAAYIPALYRGNVAFAPFEPVANNCNGFLPQAQTALAFPMQRSASIHSESSMPLQDLEELFAVTPAHYPQGNEQLSVVPLTQVNERSVSLNGLNLGENPDTYLSRTGASMSFDDMPPHDVRSGPPSLITASSVAERPWPMSRENSRVQASPILYRMPSASSFREEPHFGQGAFDSSQSCSPRKASDVSNVLLAIGNGVIPSPDQYGSLETLFPSSAPMERVHSNISINSAKSTASYSELRLKEATERTIQNGKTTPIAPMPQQLLPNTATPIAPKKERALQEGDRNKQKPKAPKICPHCVEYPNGFRGDHELRRHIRAKHKRTVKKYICRDPAKHRIYSELSALYPLDKCKACSSGKLYGAYYNAAAHLRRTHFTAKPSRARGGSLGKRNGGRGGGDWPPMKQLRLWFHEVTVEVDESGSPGTAHEFQNERSPSLSIDEAALMSELQANGPVDQLDDIDTFKDIYQSCLDPTLIYKPQSFGLNMQASGLDNDDIDMTFPPQGSLLALDPQGTEGFSSWQTPELYDQ